MKRLLKIAAYITILTTCLISFTMTEPDIKTIIQDLKNTQKLEDVKRFAQYIRHFPLAKEAKSYYNKQFAKDQKTSITNTDQMIDYFTNLSRNLYFNTLWSQVIEPIQEKGLVMQETKSSKSVQGSLFFKTDKNDFQKNLMQNSDSYLTVLYIESAKLFLDMVNKFFGPLVLKDVSFLESAKIAINRWSKNIKIPTLFLASIDENYTDIFKNSNTLNLLGLQRKKTTSSANPDGVIKNAEAILSALGKDDVNIGLDNERSTVSEHWSKDSQSYIQDIRYYVEFVEKTHRAWSKQSFDKKYHYGLILMLGMMQKVAELSEKIKSKNSELYEIGFNSISAYIFNRIANLYDVMWQQYKDAALSYAGWGWRMGQRIRLKYVPFFGEMYVPVEMVRRLHPAIAFPEFLKSKLDFVQSRVKWEQRGRVGKFISAIRPSFKVLATFGVGATVGLLTGAVATKGLPSFFTSGSTELGSNTPSLGSQPVAPLTPENLETVKKAGEALFNPGVTQNTSQEPSPSGSWNYGEAVQDASFPVVPLYRALATGATEKFKQLSGLLRSRKQ